MNKWLFYIAIVALGTSCTNKTENKVKIETGKSIYAYPGDYEADSVANIQAYFDSICKNCGAEVLIHNANRDDSIEVWNAVKELDRYVNHQRKYYPVEEIRTAIQNMAFEQGYIYSHSGEESDSANCGEIFLFRLIEQAALYSPQLDFVTTFHAEGGEAGILYFPEWSGMNPLYSFLVYKTEQGYKVLTVGEKGIAKINKIFHLLDMQGRTYYLCSNYDSPIYYRQYLYGWDGKTMTFLCELDGFDESWWDEDGNMYEIVFNPRKIRWDFCSLKNGVYQKVKGTKSFVLSLDWEKSRIHEVTADEE